MAHLLNTPESVLIQHLFPRLDHNDLVRLRRVSKQTKARADAYLWTPLQGHQGNWEVKIDSGEAGHTLEAFLQMDLPPPPRLHIVNIAEEGPREKGSFFEDDHLDDFMNRYSKFVTHLKLDKLFYPFTSAKELAFYESLTNLEELCCDEMVTVGGADQFEENTQMGEGSYLIRPTWSPKLKIFRLTSTDCMDSMWNLINGLSTNLEELLHPFKRSGVAYQLANFAPVRDFIELWGRHGGIKSKNKLLYDWRYLLENDLLERLRVFASCSDNGVRIKNLNGRYLDCLLCDGNRMIRTSEIFDPMTEEWSQQFRMIIQRNQFVGNVIHSLSGMSDYVKLIDMPALEIVDIFEAETFHHPRLGTGNPEWPNLRKMDIKMDHCSAEQFNFYLGWMKRPKLEELTLTCRRFWYMDIWRWPAPRNLGNICGNVKKMSLNCPWYDPFYVKLWKGLPLLEDVTLSNCWMLTNKGFVGNGKPGSRPVFLNLKKLRHLSIEKLEYMPRITDVAFRDVFRHLKLTSFKLSSDEPIKNVTEIGIKALLTGRFAETIEKLDLDELKLRTASDEQLKELVSRFRSSRMI